tara:strand:+ start:19115 stop:20092 length:978 start_codon:yes stop_codon:yes gene_type:complete
MPQNFTTQLSHRAMATEFVVMLAAASSHTVDLTLQALELLDQIEADLSIYHAESEISLINRDAARQPVAVSGPTFALLQKALRWSKLTEGAFDITAGPLVQAWGFGKRRGQKPSPEVIQEALQRVGYQHLRLDPHDRTVRFDRPGMSINLGAIGKGDALDRLAGQLLEGGATDFLIHGGNSSVVAMGDHQPGSGEGWAVGIAHPTKPSRRIAGIRLRDQALATSGSGKQFFHHQGQRYGHVIDPRNGQPVGDLLSLTVIGASAADSDACATGWFVAGSEFVRSREKYDDATASIMVAAGNRQDDVHITTTGSPRWVDGDAPDAST